MMIKRVNFTGRRRIPRDRVEIEVYDGSPRSFDASIPLNDLPLPAHAAVFLEAMCAGSTIIQRFPFGNVEKPEPPTERFLTDVEGENVFFTLKVVDRTEQFGRILGICEGIRPLRAGKQTAAGRRGILPIEPSDLGQQLWRLEFREHDVYLLVNKDIPGLVDRARSDPTFYATAYPEVVRRILLHALEQNVEPDEEDDRWPILWLRFGKNLHPYREEPPTREDQVEERPAWIEAVVAAFCDTHRLKDKYVATTTGGEGGEA